MLIWKPLFYLFASTSSQLNQNNLSQQPKLTTKAMSSHIEAGDCLDFQVCFKNAIIGLFCGYRNAGIFHCGARLMPIFSL